MTETKKLTKRPMSRGKRLAFRLIAVLVVVSPFVIWELTLRMIDWQPVIAVSDPFVDFQNTRPLFVPSDDGQMETAVDRREYFQKETFAAQKSSDEYRIFCLGGSTVQGRPYSIETSFSSWLELSLEAGDSETNWEVVNCGGVSYASYRLVPILQEILNHQPDLIILYTGHNEFLEERSYSGIKQTSGVVAWTYQSLGRLRSMQFLHQLVNSSRQEDLDVLNEEVDAILDYEEGLTDYRRDEQLRRSVINHFEVNLRRIVRLTQEANVPLLIIDPPANLLDCPPFKSEDSNSLDSVDVAKSNALANDARELASNDRQQAVELLSQAVNINKQHAGLHYQLGLLLYESENYSEARYHFQQAIDEDICPLRIITPLSDITHQVAVDHKIPLVKVKQRFSSLSEGMISGENLFIDHVHPNFRGHQVIAEEIMKALQKLEIIKPTAGWEDRREKLYLEQWGSLEPIYFERGRQRLEGLKKWSEGRGKKLRKNHSSY